MMRSCIQSPDSMEVYKKILEDNMYGIVNCKCK